MSVSLAKLLNNRDLSLRLCNGSPDVEVDWADISEQEDPTPFLEPGTMLLTTGLSLPPGTGRWAGYAERITRAGVPALGFGVGLTHGRVPEELLAAAGRHGLTVVEVPPDTRFSSVVRAVADGLTYDERSQQNLALARHRALLRAAATPPAHRSLVVVLAEQLNAWVLLLSRNGDLLAGAPDNARRHTERVRLAVERQRSWRAAAFDIGDAQVTVLPVGRAERPSGVLAVGRSAPCSAHERGVIDAAVALLGLDVARAADLLDSERRERAAVLGLVLAGQYELAERVAAQLGLPLPEEPVRLAVLTTEPELRGDLLEVLENNRSLQIVSALVAGDPRGRVVAVVPTVEGDIGVLQSALSSVGGSRGAVSDPLSIAEIPRVWPRIAALADTLPPAAVHRLLTVGDVAALGLLAHVDPGTARAWASALLAPLAAAESCRIDLLGTVRTYLAHNGHAEAAAAALGIHRRTLGYRLERAEALLGRRFSDPGLRAELWTALTIIDSGTGD
ncbi:PucR family transcriptional regulator [Actinomadura formosensis]|uniref:PucR family transcriptional regulator n=1 Tax=Actinomadura formosensis TaxID=60706 RepID=UPI000831FC92|nr:PucR family transcriptional regulator [Actinomadura formosensis]